VVLTVLDVPTGWIPFGAFIAANGLSVVTALIIERRARRDKRPVSFGFGDVVRSGSQLVTVEFLPAAATFIVNAIVLRVAGAEILGFAEAARIVARPVGVFADAPIGPRAFEAAITRNRAKGLRVSRLFAFMVLAICAAYIVYAGLDWSGNVMARLVPKAYLVTGLAAVAIIGAGFQKSSIPWRSQLVAGKREATLIRIEVVGNAARIPIALLAGYLESFAVPLGLIALGAVRSFLRNRALQEIYRTPPQMAGGGAIDAGGGAMPPGESVRGSVR